MLVWRTKGKKDSFIHVSSSPGTSKWSSDGLLCQYHHHHHLDKQMQCYSNDYDFWWSSCSPFPRRAFISLKLDFQHLMDLNSVGSVFPSNMGQENAS